MYKERSYRQWVKSEGLVTFEVKELETDLLISAASDLENKARVSVVNYREEISSYVRKNKIFLTSLEPIDVEVDAPRIVRAMADAGRRASVGPMAAVAGAMSEFVGRDLLNYTDEVIVENGGDIFLKTKIRRVLGIYAGESSPFSGKLALEIPPSQGGLGVCTSSGTVSHSLSFGKADAALIISGDAALADAVATAVGNIVKNKDCIEKGIELARSIEGVRGALVIVGDKLGSWGEIKLV
ncbi:MAG: UPF0280 family protein [Candidatus Omnitrophica bacterium]|nr:UPF0280 family protein [Candidatus Omnitrophota bacterium]